jgi:hypothetical protein
MSKEIDWNKVLIRCSSLSCLFTEPVSKADKEAGNLSKTAKSHLIEVYAKELWGVEKDIVTKAMQKGIEAEEAAISLLSVVDGVDYLKNDFRFENDYISGHPDILHEDTVVDIKTSWDAFTFLSNVMDDVNKSYFYQVQGYMALTKKQKARISYCLVDTPDGIIQGELYYLLKRLDVATEDNPRYQDAAEKVLRNMKFSHIDPKLRVINQIVYRNDEVIYQIPSKVEKAREFLQEVYEKHMNLVSLPQNDAV